MNDLLLRFLLERSGVRGVLVRLDQTWQDIRGDSAYPGAIERLLGEASAAAALLTGHAKVEGRLSLQLKGNAPLRTLFAECTREGTLRGIAHWQAPVPEQLGPRDLGADALLAVTIENTPRPGAEPQRYQGLVGLDADTLSLALESYFDRSEQLPTRIVLASDGRAACGLMLQLLPGAEDPDEGFHRAGVLLDTLTPAELLELPPETVLHRLFHEERVRLLAEQPLRFGCSCSRERVAAMLRGLGEAEAMAALLPSGHAEVRCEFCNRNYRFDRVEIGQLFIDTPAAPGPSTRQ